jgi:hypothetical protein
LNLPSGERKGVARIFSFRKAKLFGVGDGESENLEHDPQEKRQNCKHSDGASAGIRETVQKE